MAQITSKIKVNDKVNVTNPSGPSGQGTVTRLYGNTDNPPVDVRMDSGETLTSVQHRSVNPSFYWEKA